MDARVTALSALIACRKQNAWSDGVLKEYIVRDRLDRRDAALASRLCYGVLQNRMLLDFYISHYLNARLRDLQPVVLDILRLGVYQLTQMDRVPDSAAVNEAVNEARKYANARAAGLVNGVLRAIVARKGLPAAAVGPRHQIQPPRAPREAAGAVAREGLAGDVPGRRQRGAGDGPAAQSAPHQRHRPLSGAPEPGALDPPPQLAAGLLLRVRLGQLRDDAGF
jgi:transcription antitermination factor NusB